LAQVVNAAMASQARFDEMKAFFVGVGDGASAGVWQDLPKDRPEFRETYKRKLARQAKAKSSTEIV
jgi:3,8-divinyl chlorophyllide a/chlorophyllide a reductase subunit Y